MDMMECTELLVLFIFVTIVSGEWEHCYQSSIKYNVVFREGHHAGRFQKESDINEMRACIRKCCQTQDCDVAFVSRNKCYLVSCYTIKSCATNHLKRPKYETMMSFVAPSRRNRPKFADDSAQPFFYIAKSHEMNHTMILNAPKQRDRIANFQFQERVENHLFSRRSEIIDIILAAGASIVAITAAVITLITMMKKLTDRSEKLQYETIR
ncbi:uncharacterized protein LOC124439067 [Xenia sp. Carnegie-2017]|uniref:uncharacterized protein LOC124439067 n=1 Tax=Xenia sp. Carnegie-2017 TaxID=2897299 RepID=UPI001F04DDB9|nr:uncharacterized protein LOC124439067 [Xenia sp. Carnegie-2017]